MARETWDGERGSSMAATGGSTHHWWDRPGLPRPMEQALDYVGMLFLILFVAGWAWTVGHAKSWIPLGARASTGAQNQTRAGMVASALTNVNAPTTAYLTDAAVTMWANRL